MPFALLNTFNGEGVTKFFLWDNTPADDQAFFEWVYENGANVSDLFVDRSGEYPTLRGNIMGNIDLGGEYGWGYGPTGETYEVVLSATEEQWIWSNVPTGVRPDLLPGVVSVVGRFRCDEHGLPFNLNDMIAPSSQENTDA